MVMGREGLKHGEKWGRGKWRKMAENVEEENVRNGNIPR